MPFVNNNSAAGLAPDANFQVGRSDIDDGSVIEQGIELPWSSDPSGSYVYYDCTVECMLDGGTVVHNRMPQVNRGIDTLASTCPDDPDFEQIKDRGINLNCRDQYQDILQRMGHSRYWFRLWGQALRVGYKIPIPGIKMIGGVAAVPYDKNPQWAFNRISPGGNYGGVILWHAAWSLWYTTLTPPVNQTIPVADPSAHISAATIPPAGIQVPYSQADSNAQTSGGPKLGNPVAQK